ncbi:MAG: hypothetical protein UHK60_05355 [Acutalibacteraceae bacterium]|nr:hypothetical protein [Acutalibacteraceae bacterium]
MKRNLKNILSIIFIFIFLTGISTTTAFAVPEDYLNEFQDGVNGALDDAEVYLDDIWNNVSSAIDNTVNDVQEYINATETVTESETYTDITNDDIYEPESTEPPTEEVTVLYAPTENEDYDYSYEPPTQPPTEVYEPEILTETYTDAPFIDRFAITDAGEGNLFIALGLWIAIAIGIIIVISVVMATHKRKKGN